MPPVEKLIRNDGRLRDEERVDETAPRGELPRKHEQTEKYEESEHRTGPPPPAQRRSVPSRGQIGALGRALIVRGRVGKIQAGIVSMNDCRCESFAKCLSRFECFSRQPSSGIRKSR